MTVVGLALLVPALGALYQSYLAPTIWTVRSSFQDVNALTGRGRPAGTGNYEVVGERALDAFVYALAFAAFPLLTFLVAAPLLALCAHHAGRVGRWVARVAFAVPMVVCLAPTALAAAWLLDEIDPSGGRRPVVSDPATAPAALVGAAWGAMFGLVCGLGLTLFLAALRRREPGAPVWPGLLAVAGLGVTAVPAIALQTFVFPTVVTGGGPERSTTTPMLDVFGYGFRNFQTGAGAAESTILLALLAALGVVAALLVVLSGVRVEFDPSSRSADESPRWSGGRVTALVLGGVGLVVAVAVAWNGIWPALSRSVGGSGGEQVAPAPVATILANTWLPPLISAVIAVGVAALTGFAIGALRPLGRYSEVLLLPFAPWLFVGIGPLAIANWNDVREADQVSTFLGLIPPVTISIPALFLFTLFFKGQERRRRELVAGGVAPGGAFARALLPTVPLVVLVGGAVWLVQAQDLLWPLLVAGEPERYTGPVALLSSIRQFTRSGEAPIGLALPVAVVAVAALALAAAQVLYLDRLAIRAGPAGRGR